MNDGEVLQAIAQLKTDLICHIDKSEAKLKAELLEHDSKLRTDLLDHIHGFGTQLAVQIEGVDRRLMKRFDRIDELFDQQIAVLQLTIASIEEWADRMDRRKRLAQGGHGDCSEDATRDYDRGPFNTTN